MSPKNAAVVRAVREHAERLLNCSPRFKLFTLHGTAHITNLFAIADLLVNGGVKLSAEEAYLLSLAICVHDLGMVVGLKDSEITTLLQGKPSASDPAVIENEIREVHHVMVDLYIEKNLNFMINLSVTPAELNQVAAISKCHRKLELHKQYGLIKNLGALLRVIDELDVGPERAPFAVLSNQSPEMDATSIWHWVKHNVTESWIMDHNVIKREESGRRSLDFVLIAHPASEKSIPYWLHQIKRPINRALSDDGCAQIILDKYGINIHVTASEVRSSVSSLGLGWSSIEEKALSGGRRVILLIDDEVRKMEDLMLPLAQVYHIIYASNTVDAFTKLAATRVDLAIVDMQIGGRGLFTPEETCDYKKTGIGIIKKINAEYPNTRVGVLTGTKYDLSELEPMSLKFILKKPYDPDKFVADIKNALT